MFCDYLINLAILSFRTAVVLQDGILEKRHPKSTEWTHIVLNYIGPNNGEGINIYCNGTEVDSDTTKGH